MCTDVPRTQDRRITLTSQTVPIKPITATQNETVYFPEAKKKLLDKATLLTYLLTYLLTTWSKVLPDKLTGSQLVKKYSAFFLNPKVHYHIYNLPPPVPILSHFNPVHTPTSHSLKIHINIIISSMSGSPK